MVPDRYPVALWRPGPDWKQGYSFFRGYVNQNLSKGAVVHSAEGTLEGCEAVIHGPREASWTLTFPKVGVPVQHYSLNAITWHCGRYGDDGGQVAGNGCLVGAECEGRKGEPLTQNQIDHLMLFLGWYWRHGELGKPSRPDKAQTFPTRSIPLIKDDELWEHNEISATECPSGRIPWDTLIREMTMPEETTEWERFTKGLMQELQYVDRVLALAGKLGLQKAWLIAVWRRSLSDPPLDHEVFKEVRVLCSQMKAAIVDLEARCRTAGRG